MQQLELTGVAPEAIQISSYWSFERGWIIRIAWRASGQQWADAHVATYDGLTSEEMLDVAGLELARTLGVQD